MQTNPANNWKRSCKEIFARFWKLQFPLQYLFIALCITGGCDTQWTNAPGSELTAVYNAGHMESSHTTSTAIKCCEFLAFLQTQISQMRCSMCDCCGYVTTIRLNKQLLITAANMRLFIILVSTSLQLTEYRTHKEFKLTTVSSK